MLSTTTDEASTSKREMVSVALAQHKIRRHKLNLILFVVIAVVGLVTPYGSSVFAAPGDYSYSYSVGTRGNYIGLSGIASASDGSQWVLNTGEANEILHVSPGGSRTSAITLPATFSYSYGALAISPLDEVYVAQRDYSTNVTKILRYQSDGTLLSATTIMPSNGNNWIYSLAVDALGNLYTTSGSNVVDQFSPTGTHLSSTNTSGGGYIPYIAIRGTSLYVSDYYNGTVRQFALNGTALQTWSGLSYPAGLVPRSDGSVLVLNQGANNFAVLSPSGGVALHAPDQPVYSGSIGLDQDGNIFVIDQTGSRLQKYSSSYVYQDSYKIDTNPANALIQPNLMARDSQGNLYVLDSSNQADGSDNQHRMVRKYDATGNLIGTIPLTVQYQSSDNSSSYNANFNGMTIASDGSLVMTGWASRYQNGVSTSYAITRYSSTGGEPQFEVNNQYTDQATGDQVNINGYTIFIDPTNNDLYLGGYVSRYSQSTSTSRYYQYIRYPGGDTTQPQFVGECGGSSICTSANPYSIQRGPDGKIYMSGYMYDSAASKQYTVWRFDPQTQQTEPLIEGNTTQGVIQTNTYPYNLAIDRKGNLYLGGYINLYNTATNQQVAQYTIAKYNSEGHLITYIAQSQDPSGTSYQVDRINYMNIGQLAIDQYGNVYGLDSDSRAKVIKVYLIQPDLPSVPRNLTSSQTIDSVTVNWQEPEDDGNAPITNYVIMARQAGGTWSTVATVGPNARSYRLTSLYGKSLLSGTSYEFTIVARNKAGDSPIAELSAQTSTVTAPNTGAGAVSVLPVALAAAGLMLAIIAVVLSLLPRRRSTARHQ